MIIKKYLAATEREAIEMAKQELGSNAIVMNIKKIHPKGVFKLFVNTKVEITAALDETPSYDNVQNIQNGGKAAEKADSSHVDLKVDSFTPDLKQEDENDVGALEEKLNSLQKMLEKQMNEGRDGKEELEKTQPGNQEPVKENKTKAYKELIYKQLVENEVDEKIAADLLQEIESALSEDATIDNVLASIYQKIILKLGRPYTIDPDKNGTKFIFFLGSTGVGKTTTIAKIASHLKINRKCNLALVTADTYRIAAVEQLKTYANILNIHLKVIYSPSELAASLPDLREYDVCLIDTAGRSHRDTEQIDDIRELMEQVPIAERDVYLVLNAGTKYSDLKEIADVYSEITDYSIIFTKLDETVHNGVLMNMRVRTNCPLSYVTWGQNVPDDIGELDTQEVAKKLLGGKS